MKMLSFLRSRWFLGFLGLVVVGLVIWFLGPYLAFGGLKPLAGVGMRVFIIALLVVGVLLWLKEAPTSPAFVALVCVLIWYATPLLSFGNAQPFAPESARIIAITVVLVCFAVYWLAWVFFKMRDDEKFLEKALAFGKKKDAPPAAERLRVVEARVNSAIARLRTMRTGARGIGRLFQGTRYLYELPWFITLGSRGSGKTTALLNAGLEFPVGTTSKRFTGGSAATDNVDWWLTNDAVLIDTAGHYTRHGTSSGPVHRPKELAESAKSDTSASAAKTDPALGSSSERDDPEWRLTVDSDEWRGFLALLRRHRPRAPLNGALLTVKLDVLTAADPAVRAAEAAALRGRLEDLRTALGIRFPVYLIVTQTDHLPGFAEYFSSLTEEHRAQMWGFTLPLGNEASQIDLALRCDGELRQLASRLANGVNTRLEDEYDMDRRRRLSVLPEAFGALAAPLVDFLAQLFVDSRYDDTQLQATLRGVYFTSAVQSAQRVVAEPLTVVQRLATGLGHAVSPEEAAPQSTHSYFLQDLFAKVIVPEADLVRPNLRWEYRLRMLRLLGHALALMLFVWLAVGLHMSFENNSNYLAAIAHKTQSLAARVAALYKEPKPEAVPDTLSEALYLPTWTGLNLAEPDTSFRYGLYTAPGIADASRFTYQALEDNLLVPQIVHRLEDVISSSIASQDSKSAYDALRVYLMLYDPAKFKAGDVKAWVLDDWAKTDSASIFGGRASMIGHVEQLFSGDRVVRSPLIRNDGLIQRARAFLDSSNATQRLYDRAKADMQKEAPDEFTLLRAVGPQAGTVFTRASGAPLSRGVAGLFTFDGYRNLFDKRLHEFVDAARDDDAWVMGRSYLGEAQKKTAEIASAVTGADDPLTEAIRRLYLTEYAQQWDAFLGDIRTVSGTSLAFDLQVLRRFAAPDSPLARLANAAVHETTLTRNVSADGPSLLDKASDKVADKAEKTLGIRAAERVERELVDSHFAALREMVTGSSDTQSGGQTAGNGKAGATGLDGVTSLLNDYYTSLTVADNAIANNSLPPTSDAASKLKMAANTMPAPFREVLLGLSMQGSREVNQGIGQLLSRQMQAVVTDACRLTVEGNYPFSPESKRDVTVEDFTRVFAQGGVLDDFFTKNLLPFVDTSARPWRYKTLPGSTEPVHGPDLEPFQHAKEIRDVFFSDQGQKQLAWKADLRIAELDPTILSLSIDIDGQNALYQHGPVTPTRISWPGPRGGVHAELTASPRIRADTSTIAADGPWALMRLMRLGEVVPTATPGRTRVVFGFEGRKAVLDIATAGSVANPLTSDLLTTFRCPSSMPIFNLPDSGPPPGLPALPSQTAATAATAAAAAADPAPAASASSQ
ncbi:type VI secretion system membrane subunit TssM [Caballeronia sp. GAFFF1]|uniref:type VI secretion system membrane subunit TssM n=1 Tax=Caballeronia sp. GAFFF1 TaxID=2921779 RepID=UPI002028708D|nr:type VI secretion system membrane subunit TssM [Caballeronia sp. GAFFF1]